MEKRRDYLLKYWLDYYLNIDEIGDITIRTAYASKKYPNIKYEVSLLNDNELVVLLPTRIANKLKTKYPDTFKEISNSDEGIQLSFAEEKLQKLEEDLKLIKKKFPDDEELIERFIEYHRKKIELRKKRREKRKRITG
ncbi:MAG TPA: hypothetical protein PLM75_09205 [bacterium]|nr:hypothetical protein [bacterium]